MQLFVPCVGLALRFSTLLAGAVVLFWVVLVLVPGMVLVSCVWGSVLAFGLWLIDPLVCAGCCGVLFCIGRAGHYSLVCGYVLWVFWQVFGTLFFVLIRVLVAGAFLLVAGVVSKFCSFVCFRVICSLSGCLRFSFPACARPAARRVCAVFVCFCLGSCWPFVPFAGVFCCLGVRGVEWFWAEPFGFCVLRPSPGAFVRARSAPGFWLGVLVLCAVFWPLCFCGFGTVLASLCHRRAAILALRVLGLGVVVVCFGGVSWRPWRTAVLALSGSF
ncbi:hypothetical protein SAMN04488032_103252 [Pacificibacter marinus]|nr:hypothetical protein SAMN04488032_103252 [Pacificibacter marinus]